MTKIIFPVADMTDAMAFYGRLGFEVDGYSDGYAWVTSNGCELLHLTGVSDLGRAANRSAGYFHVQDVDDWHSAWVAAGVEPGPVRDQPWQMREFELHDSDSNLLRIGQNL